jgi:TetR/AcrR family transcriptional regulator, cholesterol catabolism regulator
MPSHRSNRRKSSANDLSLGSDRFEQQLGKILERATTVLCEKGYAGASMRDIARATGMSLAGMYHYFGNKERLLYLIQKETFSTIIARLRERLAGINDTEPRIREFILNHLQYFLEHQAAMKVLSHEDEALTGEYGKEIAAIKREYYHICRELLEHYKKEKGLEFESRTAVLALFGMVNWIYTWYNPRLDGNAERLAAQMTAIFLNGIAGREKRPLRRPHGSSLSRSRRRALDSRGPGMRRLRNKKF